ncbi:MAG: methyltransferase domain-containing protein [Bacteroidetes bacterium]|nr:methyltransferase domain-containing protein [Bacteroidota bacterium]
MNIDNSVYSDRSVGTHGKESTKSHWEDFWRDKKEFHEVYSNNDRVLRNLLRVTVLDKKKVLEVGAGTGRDSFKLTTYGASVFLLDYAASSLKIIKEIASEEEVDVNMIGGDAFGLPFENGSFDIVFHQGLLEHFRPSKAEALLDENIRVLKPGGYLLVDVPQRYHVYTLVKHALIAVDKWFAGWEREFSVLELREILRGHGLVAVRTYGEWMYPSLFYRATREALRKVGVRLPLYPTFFKPMTSIRRQLRETLRETPIVHNTALSFGIIARKPVG